MFLKHLCALGPNSSSAHSPRWAPVSRTTDHSPPRGRDGEGGLDLWTYHRHRETPGSVMTQRPGSGLHYITTAGTAARPQEPMLY